MKLIHNGCTFQNICDQKTLCKSRRQWIIFSASLLALLYFGTALPQFSNVNASIKSNQRVSLNPRLHYINKNLNNYNVKDIKDQANVLHTRILQNAFHHPQEAPNNVQYQSHHNLKDKNSIRTVGKSNLRQGVNLDCARVFYRPSTIEKYINLIHHDGGQYLQLHLTDNNNFNIENDYLGLDPAHGYYRNGIYYSNLTNRPFLTKDQLHRLINYGEARHVEVYPEIDVPAHCQALLNLVKLSQGQNISIRGINEIAYGDPKALGIVKNIISEYLPLLPKDYRFGIGGDETSLSGPYRASDMINFFNQLDDLLRSHHLQTVMYNDSFYKVTWAIGGNDAIVDLPSYYHKDILINYWSQSGAVDTDNVNRWGMDNLRVRESMSDLNRLGYQTINCNSNYTYFVTNRWSFANHDQHRLQMLNKWNPNWWYGRSDKDTTSAGSPNLFDNSANNIGSAVSLWSSDDGTSNDYNGTEGSDYYQKLIPFIDQFFQQTNHFYHSGLPIRLIYENQDGSTSSSTKYLNSYYYSRNGYFYPSSLILPTGDHLDTFKTRDKYKLVEDNWQNNQIPQIYIKIIHCPQQKISSLDLHYWNQHGQSVGCVNHIYGIVGSRLELSNAIKNKSELVPYGYKLVPGQNNHYQFRNDTETINLMVTGKSVNVPLTVNTVADDSDQHQHVSQSIKMIHGQVGDLINVLPNEYRPSSYFNDLNNQERLLRINSDQTLSDPQITYLYHRLGKTYIDYVDDKGDKVGSRVVDTNDGLHRVDDLINIKTLGTPGGYQMLSSGQRIRLRYNAQHILVPVTKIVSKELKINQIKLNLDGSKNTVLSHKIKINNSNDRSITVSPYDYIPDGYHVTNYDHDVVINLRSKSYLNEINFKYAPNYYSQLDEIRVHYVDSNDVTVGHGDHVHITNQIDEMDDHGYYGDKFNLIPYKNDLPQDDTYQYHFIKIIGDQPRMFSKRIQDVYIEVQ